MVNITSSDDGGSGANANPPPPPSSGQTPQNTVVQTTVSSRIDPRRLAFAQNDSDSNRPPPENTSNDTSATPKTISSAEAQRMLAEMGFVMTPEKDPPPRQDAVPPPLPSGGADRAASRKMLADLILSAAPAGTIPNCSNESASDALIANFYAALQGEKVKRPVPVSTTTARLAVNIANHPLPARLTIPLTIGTYSGDSDPEDFLQRFEGAIKTEHWDDAVACHMFPQVLQGNARGWFERLPAGSIVSYPDLRFKFLQQYHNLKQHTLTHLDVFEVKQGSRESLNEFITRFTTECQKISDLPPSQQIAGFIYGISKERYPTLYHRLKRKLPTVYSEVVAMARDYLRSGEDKELHTIPSHRAEHDHSQGRHHEGGSGSDRRDSHRRDFRRDPRHDNRRGDHREPPRRQPYDKNSLLSSLTKSPKEILQTETVARNAFNPPPPMEPREVPRNGKYCDFHEEYGHDTDDCRQLRKEIKIAIQAGKLNHLLPGKKFKKADSSRAYGWQKKDDPRDPPDAVIHMIHSAGASSEALTGTQQSWQLAPISFPSLQSQALNTPVVISARIGELQIPEVCADTGSAVDIIYEHCFLQLPSRLQQKLKKPLSPLSSYANDTAWPMGRVVLDTTLGDHPRSHAMNLEFVIVRAKSKFNMLLGRTALHKFGAIASTVHGLMKFPTPAGIATLQTSAITGLPCSQPSVVTLPPGNNGSTPQAQVLLDTPAELPGGVEGRYASATPTHKKTTKGEQFSNRGVQDPRARSDPQLLASQFNGAVKAKGSAVQCPALIQEMAKQLKSLEIKEAHGNENDKTDAPSKPVSCTSVHPTKKTLGKVLEQESAGPVKHCTSGRNCTPIASAEDVHPKARQQNVCSPQEGCGVTTICRAGNKQE